MKAFRGTGPTVARNALGLKDPIYVRENGRALLGENFRNADHRQGENESEKTR
jgi:hypothetical protein